MKSIADIISPEQLKKRRELFEEKFSSEIKRNYTVRQWLAEQELDSDWLAKQEYPATLKMRLYRERNKNGSTTLKVVDGKVIEIDKKEQKRRKLLSNSGIPTAYLKKSLDNFQAISPSQKKAKKLCTSLSFLDELSKGIMFIGNCGVGKTHLLCAVLAELAQKEYQVRYFRMKPIFRQVRATFSRSSDKSMQDVINPIVKAPVAFLDDIGAEKVSEWTLATLEDILDERCAEGLLTFAASNWTEEQWMKQCKGEAEKLQSQRIWSRLYQLCEIMQISGRDYRRFGK